MYTILYFLCLVFQKKLHNFVYSIYTIFQLCIFNIHNFIHSMYTIFQKKCTHFFNSFTFIVHNFSKNIHNSIYVHNSIFSKHKIFQFCILYVHKFFKMYTIMYIQCAQFFDVYIFLHKLVSVKFVRSISKQSKKVHNFLYMNIFLHPSIIS